MSAYECLTCPPMRRALCLVPCTPEIEAALVQADEDLEAVEVLAFAPPRKRDKPLYIDAPQSRIHRHRTTINDLR